MPAHWEPWPGKTNTVLPDRGTAGPRTTMRRPRRGERREPGEQFLTVAADYDRPVREMRPRRASAPHVRDVHLWPFGR